MSRQNSNLPCTPIARRDSVRTLQDRFELMDIGPNPGRGEPLVAFVQDDTKREPACHRAPRKPETLRPVLFKRPSGGVDTTRRLLFPMRRDNSDHWTGSDIPEISSNDEDFPQARSREVGSPRHESVDMPQTVFLQSPNSSSSDVQTTQRSDNGDVNELALQQSLVQPPLLKERDELNDHADTSPERKDMEEELPVGESQSTGSSMRDPVGEVRSDLHRELGEAL